MSSRFRRSTLNSPSWPNSRGGARRHPHSDIEVDGKAAERLHDVLRTLQNKILSGEPTSTRLTHTNGSPTNPGWFTTAIGGKFDFYGDERRGISVAVYPQLEFAPAHGAEKGLSEAGQTIVLPLLVAREFHAFTFVFNGELEKPLHDPSRELASGFGFAFGRSFTRKVAAMIELRTESSIDFQRDRLVLVNAGIIDGVRNVVVYANIGHSVFSDDGGHFYAGGGFKVVIGR